MSPQRCVSESHASSYFVCLRNSLEWLYVCLTQVCWIASTHVLGNCCISCRIFPFWFWCVQTPILLSIYDKCEYPRAVYLVLTLCSCLRCVDRLQVKWCALECLDVTSPSNSRKRTRHDRDGVQSYNKQTWRISVSSLYETTSPCESQIEIEG